MRIFLIEISKFKFNYRCCEKKIIFNNKFYYYVRRCKKSIIIKFKLKIFRNYNKIKIIYLSISYNFTLKLNFKF